jgi:hypothetical protein
VNPQVHRIPNPSKIYLKPQASWGVHVWFGTVFRQRENSIGCYKKQTGGFHPPYLSDWTLVNYFLTVRLKCRMLSLTSHVATLCYVKLYKLVFIPNSNLVTHPCTTKVKSRTPTCTFAPRVHLSMYMLLGSTCTLAVVVNLCTCD